MLYLQENAAALTIQLSGEEKAFLEDIFHPEKVTICTIEVCSCKSSNTCKTVCVSCGCLEFMSHYLVRFELTCMEDIYLQCMCRLLVGDIMETLPNFPTML